MLEQIVHTCTSDEDVYQNGVYRRWLYHACTLVMIVAAFVRARAPRADNDLPFVGVGIAAAAIAALPPPGLALSGPLCFPPSLFEATERVTRAFLFALVYVALVYAAAPVSSQLHDAGVCIARSTAASVWLLAASVYTLPLVFVQLAMVLYSSFSSTGLEYSGVGVDFERGRSSPLAVSAIDDDILRKAAALTDSMPPLVQNMNGMGLNFNFVPHACHSDADEHKRMAEIAATMA